MNQEDMVPMFIRPKDVKRVVGLSLSTVERREKEGLFPAKIRIGGNVGWLKSDVEAFLQKQKQLNEKHESRGED
jgi:predicted DNA-binding transcriptional regulator AlpA